jgi:hypothetical protein
MMCLGVTPDLARCAKPRPVVLERRVGALYEDGKYNGT